MTLTVSKQPELVIEFLAVKFTPDELMDFAMRQARAMQTLESESDRKKAVDAEFKEIFTGLETTCKRLARKMVIGHEMRDVECWWFFGNPTPGEKTLVRGDTREVIRTVAMNPGDYQGSIFTCETESKAAPPPAPGPGDDSPKPARVLSEDEFKLTAPPAAADVAPVAEA